MQLFDAIRQQFSFRVEQLGISKICRMKKHTVLHLCGDVLLELTPPQLLFVILRCTDARDGIGRIGNTNEHLHQRSSPRLISRSISRCCSRCSVCTCTL
jgi:hypothetical protein